MYVGEKATVIVYNKFVDEIYQNLNISLDEAAQKLSNIFTIALVNHGYLKKAMNEAGELIEVAKKRKHF